MSNDSDTSSVPLATITEFEQGIGRDLVLAHHDAVSAAAAVEEAPPKGLILHAMCVDEAGAFRVIDIWESAADARAFAEGLLAAALATLPDDLAVPGDQRSTSCELLRVVRQPS